MVYGHVLGIFLAVSLQALADTWTTQNQSPPPSPCPDIFQYQVDPGGIWSGLINVRSLEPDFNVKLKVELGLNAILPTQYAGKIQLEEQKYEVWRRLITGDKRPVQYRVYFPLSWPLPVVKYIASNQNVLCSANPQPTITKLSLEHTLYPVRLNGLPEQIAANKNNPAIQGNKSNLNLQEQNVKVYYQQYPPPQGNNQGNFNLQNQGVKVYYQPYQPPQSDLSQGNDKHTFDLQDQDVRMYYHQYAPSQSSQPQYQSGVQYQQSVASQQNQTTIPRQPTIQYQPVQYQPNVQYPQGMTPQQNQTTIPRQPIIQYQPVQYRPDVQYPQGMTPQQNQTTIPRQPTIQYQPVQYRPDVQYPQDMTPQQNQTTIPQQPPIQYQPPQHNIQYQPLDPHQPVGQYQPIGPSQTIPQLLPDTPQKVIPSQSDEFHNIPPVQSPSRAEPVKPAPPIHAHTNPSPHLTPPPRTTRPSTTTTTTTTTTQAPDKILEDECGISMTEVVPLVINGLPTARGEWPWLVAMFVKSKSVGLQFQCGGSLLSRTIVLTAAHCVKYRDKPEVKADSIVLYMGKFNLQKWTEANTQARDVEKVHIHPDYKSSDRKSEADLAIMVLKEEVEYTFYVRPICLWIFKSDINQIVGQTGTVVGWGKDETGTSSSEPHKVSVPIVSHGDCVLSNKEFFYYVTNRTFCAGLRDGTGPCSGDSGGGFMIGYQEGNILRWYLRGVVHLSLYDRQNQQCDLQSYLIYTDVAMFMDWVREFVP